MARLTVAQLASQLEAAHAAYERLATQHESLRAQADLLRTLAAKASAAPAAPVDRKAAMAAAREQAMATGRCVRAF